MNSRWIIVSLLACGIASAADPQEELKFAGRLGARGLEEMAEKILSDLEKSSDPAAARAGRFGKALLQKQRASIARQVFLRDLEEGRPPRVKRDDVLAAYRDAKPKISEYVKVRKEDLDARFLLGELLQEYAEFLTGADYPDTMVEERAALVGTHAGEAEKLFEEAIAHYEAVYKVTSKVVNADTPDDSPVYLQMVNAQYKKANARLRWALLYPSGPKFQYRAEEAIEELDEFLSEHFEDIFGGYAMLDLGICNLERGLRLGDEDAAETAAHYFSTLYGTIKEDPTISETIEVVAKAFYWHAKACNAMARGDGALKRAQPIYYETTVRSGADLKDKLKYGYKHAYALRAQLLVAEAYAVQNRYDAAVALAGDVLATARVEGQRGVANLATAKLTNWVAQVRGAGTLEAGLLFQIGESLAAQGRIGNAITFFEKTIAASEGDEDNEKWAYPARLRIATGYRRDKRLIAAAEVAWELVQDYIKSGQEEDAPFGQVASEACNIARLSWKQIAEFTKRGNDASTYQEVLGIFRDKFPGHPENSDAEFAEAREEYNKGKYALAARLLKETSPTSRNYWLAQRLVPSCYRNLAHAEKDKAKATRLHSQCLTASQELIQLTQGKDDPGAKKALQYGHLYTAMAQSSLEQWEDARNTIDRYLAAYPAQFIQRGLEYRIKIEAHLALGQLPEAEAALALLVSKLPGSAHVTPMTFNVYTALRKKYKTLPGKGRTEMASRAANLYEAWMKRQKKQNYKLLYFYADVLADAGRYLEAGDAYAAAAEGVPEPNVKAAYRLKAAEMKYKHAMETKGIRRIDLKKILDQTRQLFTDVLIPPTNDPDRKRQLQVLKTLGGKAWPGPSTFGQVKRNPEALLTAAEIYTQSSPEGINGYQVALRLIHHLHSFLRGSTDPEHPELEDKIPIFWAAAQLKLETYLAIAKSGTGVTEKDAAKKGAAFARKLIFQYPSMDSPERVQAIKALEAQLKARAR
jgi:hypothetical protein